MDVAGKTYLVTGGAGFIGSHVVKSLLAQHAKVIVIDDYNDFYDPAIKEANLADVSENPSLAIHRLDIRDAGAMASVFGVYGDAIATGGIIHLAARAGVRPSLAEPQLYVETNVQGTLNLAELAKQHGIRKFIFASSSSVYGNSPESVPFQETQDVSRPISPYAATKAMGENLLHSYAHLYDLQVVALRFFTVYGAGQRPDLAIHKFTKLISEGKSIPLFGDGTTRRDYTYIEDILQGIMAAIVFEHPANITPYTVFNLGESQTTTLIDLVRTIKSALGKTANIDWQPLQPGDVSITYADIAKAREQLGYNPQTKIVDGIPKFVEWYLSHSNKATASVG